MGVDRHLVTVSPQMGGGEGSDIREGDDAGGGGY